MALSRKTLINTNDILGPILIADGQDRNGAAAIQFVSGAGTIVLEATLDNALLADNSTPNSNCIWFALKLTDNTLAQVNNLGAAGYGWSEVVGVRAVRARASVGGGGSGADVIISVKIS